MTDHKNKEYKHIKQTHLTNQQNIAQITQWTFFYTHMHFYMRLFHCNIAVYCCDELNGYSLKSVSNVGTVF